jgi:hypothetical protein
MCNAVITDKQDLIEELITQALVDAVIVIDVPRAIDFLYNNQEALPAIVFRSPTKIKREFSESLVLTIYTGYEPESALKYIQWIEASIAVLN